MSRELRITLVIILCFIVQFVGMGVFMFMKIPTAPYLPLYWAGIGVSGIAAIISALLADRVNTGGVMSGAIGLFLFIVSAIALTPK